MKTNKTTKRHILLLYQHLMDRLWAPTIVLGSMFFAVWWWSGVLFPTIESPYDLFIAIISFVVLFFGIFAFLARKMSYVQVRSDHLRVVTPFLQLRISYRRVLSAHPAEFKSLFPPQKSSWAQRRFLESYYGNTAVVMELSAFPISPGILHLFLPSQMFDPRSKGLVFLVEDWMGLSTEIDSFQGAWRQRQSRKGKPEPGFGILRSLRYK
jgi:hypothetical protein